MRLNSRFFTLVASVCFAAVAHAQSPPPPQPTAISHVRLADGDDAPLVSILVVNGRITEILSAEDELPAGMIELDAEGGLALPAFIDGYTWAGIETPEPKGVMDEMSSLAGNVHIGMREANRKGLQPALHGARIFALDDAGRETFREAGFAVIHSSPAGQVLAGQTVVTTLGTLALRDRVVSADLFQAAGLRASGSGYPSTLMGYLAHLRQFVLDARYQALRLERVAAGKPDRRPPFDADLEAIGRVLRGEQALLCHADSATDILRWLKFAEKQNVKVIIGGGREAWRVTDQLLAARVPVLLGLDWGDEVDDPDAQDEDEDEAQEEDAEAEAEPEEEATPETAQDAEADVQASESATEEVDAADETARQDVDTNTEEDEAEAEEEDDPDWIYEEPIEIQRERRRIWEERRDCALRLQEAGVPFAFGSIEQSPSDLLDNVRTLVELGLDEQVALAGLTTTSARLLGEGVRLGKLEPGFAGNIAVWSGSPWAEESQLNAMVIDGETFEYEPEEDIASGTPADGLDLTGTWKITYEGDAGAPAILKLVMEEDGSLTGELKFEMPDGTKSKTKVEGQLSDNEMLLKGSIEAGNFSATMRIKGTVEGDSMDGDATWKYSGGEDSNSFKATRQPDHDWSGHSHGNSFPQSGGSR